MKKRKKRQDGIEQRSYVTYWVYICMIDFNEICERIEMRVGEKIEVNKFFECKEEYRLIAQRKLMTRNTTLLVLCLRCLATRPELASK